jgi:hypothetical protein|tara:strand:- start:330 stop:1676 length:1347 start_codon:yes stop_codon:yes gene_type:complete
MSELDDLIKLLQTEVKHSQSSYVYYNNDTGSIIRISGIEHPLDENELVLEVPYNIASPILSGEKRTTDFIVMYDMALKEKVLKEKNYQDTHKEASQMCYQLPVIKKNRSGHMGTTEIYDGVEVYMWFKDTEYKKDNLVWYKGNVYKILKENKQGSVFSKNNTVLFVADVQLTTLPTQSISITRVVPEFTQEYVGVHIDIWYSELEHLKGQHVWIGNCVYMILEDQPAGTEFNPKNVEMIVSNVLLFKDENTSLSFITHIRDGDTYLENNKMYSASVKEEEYNKSSNDIVFYSGKSNIIKTREDDTLLRFNTIDPSDYAILKNDLKLIDQQDLINGSKVLLGKKLYQVQLDASYDIIVTQDKKQKLWTLELNPATLTYMQLTRSDLNDVLYFSITAKHDPNILYKSLKLPMSSFEKNLVIPFDYDSEMDDVSLYTAKYFDSYAHEVIEI